MKRWRVETRGVVERETVVETTEDATEEEAIEAARRAPGHAWHAFEAEEEARAVPIRTARRAGA